MRIYYFGELIEDTNNPNPKQIQQTKMAFDEEPEKKTGIPSIGDILKEIDLNLDVYRPFKKVLQ